MARTSRGRGNNSIGDFAAKYCRIFRSAFYSSPMEFLRQMIDFVLHINVHLDALVANYGIWVYAILFLIVFAETGLVVTPFLPGDSLLFAIGALAAADPGRGLGAPL